MRQIRFTGRFKKDFKKLRRDKTIDVELTAVTKLLAVDSGLPQNMGDHPLIGNWKGYRECHIRPDLLLIYRKPDAKHLDLVRIGSHAELFG